MKRGPREKLASADLTPTRPAAHPCLPICSVHALHPGPWARCRKKERAWSSTSLGISQSDGNRVNFQHSKERRTITEKYDKT